MISHKFNGITILEMMLVLAIAAAIILLGFRQFQMYRIQNYYATLKYDVDVLFQGLEQYYQANCTGPLLWPASSTYAVVPLSYADIAPYLPGQWPLYSPVVFDPGTGSTASSFYAQYNPLIQNPPVAKNTYVCFNFGSVSCTTPQTISGTIVVMWQTQVVVKMSDPQNAVNYIGIVGATCGTNTFSPTSGTPIDCSMNVGLTEASYLVWQRLPSFPSRAVASSHWVANPVPKLFNQQYTNDPMYELYNPTASPSGSNKVYYRNYLCGG